jgi:hypothetical protein
MDGSGKACIPHFDLSAAEKTSALSASTATGQAYNCEFAALVGTRKVSVAVEPQKKSKIPVVFIAKIMDDISDEDGWVHLCALGTNITKL